MKKVLLQVKTKKSNIIYCYVLLSLVFLMNNAFSVISIDTIEKLSKIGKDPDYPMDGEYEITQDIDARETLTWNLNTGFESIGSEDNRFMGKLNGNNHVIWGLYINSPKLNYKGLFGSIGNTAVISNLGLQDVNISGRYYVGGITAQNYGGKIENCFVIGGSISGESSVGGIVGDNYGQVYECYSIVKIIGSKNNSSNIGGLIGYNNQMGSIVYCYSAGYINASGTYIGGLIGANGNRTMENTSYWDIDVSGQTTSAHGIGKNSSEMRKMSTFVDWDFVNCWQIKENVTYPYFVNQNVFIPNLEQKDKDESITLLNNQYLVIAEITQQCSNDIPQNKVISSSPGFGEVIFQGNTVSLLVSTGPCSEGEGIIEGEGVLEGVLEGTSEGEGVLEGVLEGISEGEGAQEGEGITEGTTEGILEGEGVIEGEGLFDPCHIDGCEEVCDDVLGESHFEEDLRWLYGLAGVNADTADLDRNGMLDVVQAWLLDEVLRDKGYVVHCCVKIVYRKNVEASKAYADAIKEVKPAVFLIIDRTKFEGVIAGLTTVGEQSMIDTIDMLLGMIDNLPIGVPMPDTGTFDLSMSRYLSIIGDADMDGACNIGEYRWALDNGIGIDGYQQNVLDASAVDNGGGCVLCPEGEGVLEGEGMLEGEGIVEGIIEGIPAEGEGILEGEGIIEGSIEGISEGEGVLEGSLEGISEGEGVQEGEGMIEGEGKLEGINEGTGGSEGVTEGEGITEGEGKSEGINEGRIEGEGKVEGSKEGSVEGKNGEQPSPEGSTGGNENTKEKGCGCGGKSINEKDTWWKYLIDLLLMGVLVFAMTGLQKKEK